MEDGPEAKLGLCGPYGLRVLEFRMLSWAFRLRGGNFLLWFNGLTEIFARCWFCIDFLLGSPPWVSDSGCIVKRSVEVVACPAWRILDT